MESQSVLDTHGPRWTRGAEKKMTEPLTYTPEGAAQALGIGRSKTFELIASGEIESVKIGRRRLIPVDALHSFLDRLREGSPA